MTAGEHSTAELADLFGVGRSTVYRTLERSKNATAVGPFVAGIVPQRTPLRDG